MIREDNKVKSISNMHFARVKSGCIPWLALCKQHRKEGVEGIVLVCFNNINTEGGVQTLLFSHGKEKNYKKITRNTNVTKIILG